MSTVKNRGKIFDALLEMHGVGLMAAGSGTASTAIDLGGGALQRDTQVFAEAKLIIDISACSSAATTEHYEIWLQGSHDSTFTTFHTLLAIKLGAIATGIDEFLNCRVSSEATWPGPAALPIRMTYPICNDFAGTVYRWLRIYTAICATITTGINYYAFLSI